jgi:hypothetical protein
MKTEGRLTPYRFKGTTADAIFAVLCVCVQNIRKNLAYPQPVLALLFAAMLAAVRQFQAG